MSAYRPVVEFPKGEAVYGHGPYRYRKVGHRCRSCSEWFGHWTTYRRCCPSCGAISDGAYGAYWFRTVVESARRVYLDPKRPWYLFWKPRRWRWQLRSEVSKCP